MLFRSPNVFAHAIKHLNANDFLLVTALADTDMGIVDEQGILEVFHADPAELCYAKIVVEGILEPFIPPSVLVKNILDPFEKHFDVNWTVKDDKTGFCLQPGRREAAEYDKRNASPRRFRRQFGGLSQIDVILMQAQLPCIDARADKTAS